MWTDGDSQIELRIEGDEDAPHHRFLELAKLVLPKLAEIEKASDAYLRQFAGDGGGFYQGAWRLQSIRMRQDHDSKHLFGTTFEAMLAIGGDDYGQWSVRFARHTYPSPEMFSPYFFARRQR